MAINGRFSDALVKTLKPESFQETVCPMSTGLRFGRFLKRRTRDFGREGLTVFWKIYR